MTGSLRCAAGLPSIAAPPCSPPLVDGIRRVVPGRPVVGSMTPVTPVHEEVHERACGKQQPRQVRKHVRAVLDNQKERADGRERGKSDPRTRTPPVIARFGWRHNVPRRKRIKFPMPIVELNLRRRSHPGRPIVACADDCRRPSATPCSRRKVPVPTRPGPPRESLPVRRHAFVLVVANAGGGQSASASVIATNPQFDRTAPTLHSRCRQQCGYPITIS